MTRRWRDESWPDARVPLLLVELEATQISAQALEVERVRVVRELRALDVPWSSIGKALSMSKQAAWLRYGRCEGTE